MSSLLKMLIVSLAILALMTPALAADSGVDAAVATDAAAVAAESAPATAAGMPDTAALMATAVGPDGLVAPVAGPVEGVSIVVQLLRQGHWKLGIAAILLVLLSMTKSAWSFVPPDWRPHFVAISVATTVFSPMVLGGAAVTESLWVAVQVTAFTTWFYTLGKQLLGKIPGIGKMFTSAESGGTS